MDASVVPEQHHVHKPKKNWLLVAVCVLIVLNVFVAALVILDVGHEQSLMIPKTSKYPLLRADIASLNDEQFSTVQRSLYYKPLKAEYLAVVANGTDVGIYFEDLTTGAWVGLNERQKFVGASLLKTQLAATVLKKVEDGTISLTDPITLKPSDLNPEFGSLALKGSGYETTVGSLLQIMLQESDDTAANALAGVTTTNEWAETRLTMGLPLPDFQNDFTLVTPKEYANIFRSLYVSTYLTREHSQYVLSLLTNTPFIDGLVAGIPEGIPVSHKIGERAEGLYVHDCGIVYASNAPYMLCVMVEGRQKSEAKQIIARVSEETYRFVAEQNK